MSILFDRFSHPFYDFEVEVLNHLLITHSQLYRVSWAHIKVFQYLCEYKKCVPIMPLFLHFFKAQRISIDCLMVKAWYILGNAPKYLKYI